MAVGRHTQTSIWWCDLTAYASPRSVYKLVQLHVTLDAAVMCVLWMVGMFNDRHWPKQADAGVHRKRVLQWLVG